MDVAPTVLGLAGIDAENQFQGRNLLADGRPPTEDLPVYAEQDYEWGFWAALRWPEAKIIAEPGEQYKLLDLRSDPSEMQNLYPTQPDAYAEWVRRIQRWIARNREHPARPAAPVELPPDVEEQLRALGYLK
jgi:arylsulfatase A-like enzyme